MQLNFFDKLFERSNKEIKLASSLDDASKNIYYLRDQLEVANRNLDIPDDYYEVLNEEFKKLYYAVDFLRYELQINNRLKEVKSTKEIGVNSPQPYAYNERSPLDWYNISKRDFGKLKTLILANSDIWDKEKMTKEASITAENRINEIVFRFKQLADAV